METPPQPAPPQLGLYVHLPFCPSRCPYCDFNARPFAPAQAQALIPALLKHLELAAPLAAGRALDHLYLGGGTPSLWPVKELARLLQAAGAQLGYNPGAEITLEANPGALSPRKLELLLAAGVNRVSLGAQSFDPALLALLGRRHWPDHTRRAVAAARRAGLTNLSLDLIYGLPGQSLAQASSDIAAALDLEPEHLSLYELTLGPGTPFARRYVKHQPPLPSEDEVLAMEEAALTMLEAAGLARYEVSNFSRPRRQCRHNQSTWRGGDYLALGPGAHGHLAGRRWAWRADIGEYLQALAIGEQPLDFQEYLTPAQRALELVMLGLRTVEGVDLERLAQLLGEDPSRIFAAALTSLQARGWASLDGGFLRPTPRGLRLADAAAALFV